MQSKEMMTLKKETEENPSGFEKEPKRMTRNESSAAFKLASQWVN